MKIRHSTFLNNNAKNGGAISTYRAFVEIESCFFMMNNATYNGGAIFAQGGKINTYMSNYFQNNSAKNKPMIFLSNL